MTKKILLVDDDSEVLASLRFQLGNRFEVETAKGAEYGIKAVLTTGPYAVVVSDLRMPHVDGVRFLTWLESQSPNTVRVLHTAYADLQVSITAINEGHIFRLLTKPCATKDMIKALQDGLRQYELVESEKTLLEETLSGSVNLLIELLAIASPVSFGRAEKTRDYVKSFPASEKNGDEWELGVAAMLSRIGAVTMPDTVIEKINAGKDLSSVEQSMYGRIPQIGHDLLTNIPRLQNVANIILHHQKRFDGGEPPKHPVSGDKIPYASRVLKVFSDMVDLESSGLSRADAFAGMSSRTGWYDPDIMRKLGELPELQHDAVPERKVQRIIQCSVSDLRPGLVLHSAVMTIKGLRLLNAGVAISPPMLEKIRNHAELTGVKEPIEVVW